MLIGTFNFFFFSRKTVFTEYFNLYLVTIKNVMSKQATAAQ